MLATQSITSWCNNLATVRTYSRASIQTYCRASVQTYCRALSKVIPSLEFMPNAGARVRAKGLFRPIHSAKLRQNTRFSARLQQKFQQKIPIQQGFSEIFCCQQGSSKSFSKKNYSAGIQQNILLSARVQQIYHEESTIGDKSVKYKLFCFCYWPGSYLNQYDSRPWRPVAKGGEGCLETNGIQPFLGFTGPSWKKHTMYSSEIKYSW